MDRIMTSLKDMLLKLEAVYTDKLDGNKKLEKAAFFIILALIGLVIYKLNRYTPWVVDDIIKGENVRDPHTLNEWFGHLYHFYLGWGGRVWGELYALLFLNMPKAVFNYLNSLGYLAFVLLIYVNMTGRFKISPVLLVLTNFLLFACLPAFGQDILWISGCANYMWASLFPLLYLACLRFYYNRQISWYHSLPFMALYLVLGILSGWSNENVSVGLILILAGYMYFYREMYGAVPAFAKAGAIGVLIGSALLWLAPGNFARFAAEGHSKSVGHILHEMYRNAVVLFNPESTLLLVVIFVALLMLCEARNKKLSVMFMAGAVLSSIAFGVVGEIHTRVFLGVVMLMSISVGILFDGWEGNLQARKFKFVLALVLIMATSSFYSTARSGIQDFGKRYELNMAIIQAEKAKGNLDVYVNPIAPANKFCAAYGLEDIKPAEDNKNWLNAGIAHAFGLNSIQSIKIDNKK